MDGIEAQRTNDIFCRLQTTKNVVCAAHSHACYSSSPKFTLWRATAAHSIAFFTRFVLSAARLQLVQNTIAEPCDQEDRFAWLVLCHFFAQLRSLHSYATLSAQTWFLQSCWSDIIPRSGD